MVSPNPQETEGQQPVSQVESKVADVEALKKALAEETAKAESSLAGWQRAQADFINYKRHREQEKADVIKFASTELMRSILPVLDDFQRAIEAIPPQFATETWVQGVKLIERKLYSALELKGLTRIQSLGEEFDPRIHEAVAFGKGKKDTVVKELEKGYRLHDRVIRAAKVIVGNGEEEYKEE